MNHILKTSKITKNVKNVVNVVLINGLTRSGKDTLADYMVENYKFCKKALADNFKKILARTFDISLDELDYLKNNKKLYYTDSTSSQRSVTFREILQRFSTEGMQTLFGKDIWVKRVIKEINNSSENLFVVSDLRFLAEYKAFLDSGFNIVTIHVSNNRSVIYNHRSDNELKNFNFDYYIENNDTIDKYYNNCKNTVECILKDIRC